MALRFASNSVARFSSVVSVDWDNVSNKPDGLPIKVGSSLVLNGLNGGLLYNNNGVLGNHPATVTGYREFLAGDRSYFVNPISGSDISNSGLDSGHAFQTLAHALLIVRNTIDTQGHNVFIEPGTGTYAEALALDGPHVGGGTIFILGSDVTTPSNCLISPASGDAVALRNGASIYLWGVKLSAAAGDCLTCDTISRVKINAVEFGACSGQQITLNNGAVLGVDGGYSISGNPGGAHIHMPSVSTFIAQGATITLIGARAWGAYFIGMRGPSYANFVGVTFAGSSATNSRGVVHIGAVLDCEGSDPDFIPGSSPVLVEQGGDFIAKKRLLAPGASQTFGVGDPGMLDVFDDVGKIATVAYSNTSGTPQLYVVWANSPADFVFGVDPGPGVDKWFLEPDGKFTNRFTGSNSLRVTYRTPTIIT